jgi:hypothetical protein
MLETSQPIISTTIKQIAKKVMKVGDTYELAKES